MARNDAKNPAAKDSSPAAGRTKKAKEPKDPNKKGRIRQMVEVYHFTRKVDKTTTPYMVLGLVLSLAIAMTLSGLLIKSIWYGIFLGLAVGVLVAMMILARKAEAAAYTRIKDQPGAALAAMQSIRRGWNVYEEPVQVDPRSQKMVFRASGRAGVAIVADDGSGPSMRLLDKETKRVKRLLREEAVPVHVMIVGDGEGEIPLHKIASHMQRLKKKLTKRRLAALTPPLRNAVPKGVDPTRARPSKKAMMRGGR
jgi:hypothetical protein